MVLALGLQVMYKSLDFTVEVFMFSNSQFEGKMPDDPGANLATNEIHRFVSGENSKGLPPLVLNARLNERQKWSVSHLLVDSQNETSSEFRSRVKSLQFSERTSRFSGTDLEIRPKLGHSYSLIGLHLETNNSYEDEKLRARKSFYLGQINNLLGKWSSEDRSYEDRTIFISPFDPEKTKSALATVVLPNKNPIFCCEQPQFSVHGLGAQDGTGTQYITFPTPGNYKKFKMGTRDGVWFTKDMKEGVVPVPVK